MLENTTIARPYAQAVFELAGDEGRLDQWSAMLKQLATIVSDSQMRSLLSNPRVTPDQLKSIVTDVYDGNLSTTESNLITVLISADRLGFVPFISGLFEDMRAQAEGRIDIRVTTAYELTSEQEQRIAEAMTKRLGKKISIGSKVDSSLIGGMVIRAGDSVIDASLRGRLNALKNELV